MVYAPTKDVCTLNWNQISLQNTSVKLQHFYNYHSLIYATINNVNNNNTSHHYAFRPRRGLHLSILTDIWSRPNF